MQRWVSTSLGFILTPTRRRSWSRSRGFSIGSRGRRFRHQVLLYENNHDFLEKTLDFVQQGLSRNEPSIVILEQDKNDALRTLLGRKPTDVVFADMAVVGRNPAHIIPALQQFLDGWSFDRRAVRGIVEPISTARDDAELIECERHEALLHRAFHGRSLSLICPYDVRSLQISVIGGALQRHPYVLQGDTTTFSSSFHGGRPLDSLLGDVLPAPPKELQWKEFGIGDLAAVRDFVRTGVLETDVPIERVEETVVAINEVASNSIRHGGGRGKIAIWREPDRILCEVHDDGRLKDPLVDRVQVPPWNSHGRGLWLANQLCDLVQIRSGARGTSVRVHVHLS